MKSLELPVWHCEFQPLENRSLEALTVGTKFLLSCRGDLRVEWKGRPHFVTPENTPEHSLDILSVKTLESDRAEIIVTGYRPGEFKPNFVRVMGDASGFEATGLEWKIQSVIKQGEQPKPYGPFGPFQFPFPIWVWEVLALVLILIVAMIWWSVRRILKRRRLQAHLAAYKNSAISPAAQFQKELRAILKKINSSYAVDISEWSRNLDQAIRVYLLREFRILTFDEPRSRLLKHWSEADRGSFEEFAPVLKRIFSEMDRFESHAKEHAPTEFEQIVSMARTWNDKIEKWKVRRI